MSEFLTELAVVLAAPVLACVGIWAAVVLPERLSDAAGRRRLRKQLDARERSRWSKECPLVDEDRARSFNQLLQAGEIEHRGKYTYARVEHHPYGVFTVSEARYHRGKGQWELL